MGISCRMCNGCSCIEGDRIAGYRFVECTACGFVFCPEIDAGTMQARARDGYHGGRDQAPAQGRADAGFLTPVLALAGEDPLRILDFGCGSSTVPAQLRARGHRVTAVDLHPPMCPHPDRLTGDLLELDLPGDHFDLVYAFQVFEHLPHPRHILDELFRLTAPGGLIAIHTDMETPERGALADWWYVLPPDHCSFYRHRTFERFVDGTSHSLVLGLPKMIVMRKSRAARACTLGTPEYRPRSGTHTHDPARLVAQLGCDGSTK